MRTDGDGVLVVTKEDEVWLAEEPGEMLVVVDGVPEEVVGAAEADEMEEGGDVVDTESEVAEQEAKSVRVGLRFVSMTVTMKGTVMVETVSETHEEQTKHSARTIRYDTHRTHQPRHKNRK